MAKKSSVEKNNNRKALVKKFAGKRARLKAVTQDRSVEACTAAAQFGQEPSAQSLRSDRPSARLLPQAAYVAFVPSGNVEPGSHPWNGQVELVSGSGE